MLFCIVCDSKLNRSGSRFCSNKCQGDFAYLQYIGSWKEGKVNGNRGVNAMNISGHVVRYLRSKYNSCSICGWNKCNPVTGKVPLEIDHIDGNFENNTEENLRLICPNCHALTSTFRNLNKGKGRSWRRLKYLRTVG